MNLNGLHIIMELGSAYQFSDGYWQFSPILASGNISEEWFEVDFDNIEQEILDILEENGIYPNLRHRA